MDSSAYQSCKARKKSTACASTPVPQIPHPAHTATRMCPKNTHKSTCAGSGPMRTALCCFPPCTPEHYARQLHGSGHTRPLASAKNIQETNTRLHVQARQIGMGAVAARAHRRCVCAYRRQSNVGEARQCVSVKMTVCNNWVAFSIFAGTIFSKRFCREGTRSEEHPSQHSPANSLIISITNARYRSAVLREARPFNHS